MRCNLQIEGTGAKPEDVIIDAGSDYDGPEPTAKPGGYAKDVVLRIDRADGFVGRNSRAGLRSTPSTTRRSTASCSTA